MFLIVEINYLAILVASIVATIVGMLWYGPLFGKQWQSYMVRMGKPIPEKMDSGAKKSMAIGFVVTLVMAYVLHLFVSLLSVDTIGKAIELGVIVWLGFMATVLANLIVYEVREKKVTYVGAGYYLVTTVLMTITLVLML